MRAAQQHQLYRLTDRLSRAESWTDIYEAALDAILATLQADRASVLLFDEQDVVRFRAWRGLSERYRRAVDGHTPWPRGTVDPEPIYMDDVAAAPLDDLLRKVVEGEGIRALAFIPLIYHGELLGKFMVYYDAPHRFTLDEEQLAQTIAAQLAFGIERKRAEEALRESEAHLQLTTRAAQVGTWQWNIKTGALTWSAIHKQLWGYESSPGPIAYEDWARLLDGDDLKRAEQAIERCVQDNEPYDVEYRITPLGTHEQRWIRSTGRADFDAAGEAVLLQGVSFDITERKALERLQHDFVANVSHELRNPLSSIKGYAQLMRRRSSYDERAIGAILSQTGQLERLIEDLLEASRLEAGRLELKTERVDLVTRVLAAAELAQAMTERHRVRLEAPDRRIEGQWDPDRLNQVLQNLLSNAIKYSPNGGEIMVRIEHHGTEATVSVRDQGVGMTPEALSKLFERFYRAGIASGTVQGLGLGLYISKELVEAHGGRIWAESHGPGRGSTFCVALPLEHDPD